jgi:DNA-binding transcriptional LysR family regulator
VRLRVPHFVAVGHLLSETDMIATVPERFASRCVKPFGLTYVTHPAKLPEIAINVFWHAKFHREPGNQWLRTLIFNTFSSPTVVSDTTPPRDKRSAVNRRGDAPSRRR